MIADRLMQAENLLSLQAKGEKYLKNNTNVQKKNDNIVLSADDKLAFVKAMKIGYYKEFHKQGLITDQQLEMLIALQDSHDIKKTASEQRTESSRSYPKKPK